MNPKEAILKYFCEMDIEMLEMVLDDGRTYDGARKDVFLKRLNELFNKFKKNNDKYLIPHNGKSIGSCGHNGISGYAFVGNNSRNYLELIFEINGTDVIDIASCGYFKY